MAETKNEKKSYDRPTLEKKQKLVEIVESFAVTATGTPPVG